VLGLWSAIIAGVLVVAGVLIARAAGTGPIPAAAGSAHILKPGPVSALNAGSADGMNAGAYEPGAGSFPAATVTPARHPVAKAPSSSPAAASQRALQSAPAGGFAPYVDATEYPPYNLVSTAQQTGVKLFNLAFIVAGNGGCTPEWGGTTPVGADPVAAQIGALRAIAGDVRISFGGEAGQELALTCSSAAQLEAAYQQVISAYHVTKVDFDIEGAALDDSAANTLRDQALAALQQQDSGLQISFTVPVIPSGLGSDTIAMLAGAVQAGVQISAVDIMTMDYGDGAAPNPGGMMGSYAIDAATAADAQVASVLGIGDDAAWSKIAVTPMIGVNDVTDEIFTLANARQLEAFAASKHLAWLSMWSASRDTGCAGGAQLSAQPMCSSVAQAPGAFTAALGAYGDAG